MVSEFKDREILFIIEMKVFYMLQLQKLVIEREDGEDQLDVEQLMKDRKLKNYRNLKYFEIELCRQVFS